MAKPQGAAFWMGAQTLPIPMTMFRENREKVIGELRKVRTFDGTALIVLQGGDNISHYDTDVDYVFRQVSSDCTSDSNCNDNDFWKESP
ncbi:hypothetical protein RP20_CCG017740 [Aedes albopictus]|nr:hypothetical protein RP20_CCG017740 [Aedes albopictus]